MVKGWLEVPTKWGKGKRQHLSEVHFQAWCGQGFRSLSVGQGNVLWELPLRSLDRLLPKHLGTGYPRGFGWGKAEYLDARPPVAGSSAMVTPLLPFPSSPFFPFPSPGSGAGG